MDNKVIKELLKTQLEIYSGLKLDGIQERRFKKNEKKRIGFVLNNFDFEPYRQKYEKVYKRYAEFYGNMTQIQDYLKAKYSFISNKIWDVKQKIKNNLKKQLEENGEKHGET